MLLSWWRILTNAKSKRTRHRARSPLPGQSSSRLQLEWLEDRLAPTTHTWSGAASEWWSKDANWAGGSPAGDMFADLVFPAGAANVNPSTNDLNGLTIHRIIFSDFYIIEGKQITLNAGIIMTAPSGSPLL